MQLGRYRLDEQVGQGGMAVVWRGFDTQLKRTVAVKVLHAHLHGREEIRKRFSREAHAVARLHHPHILDVYDSSDPSAEPSWMVMEFVRGTNLRAFGELHAFDPPELAAACLLPVCEALEHAHQGGVIHRDLKPENVMVRDDGTVKLTDFGIAAIVEPDEKFTATGQILGSPAHLAPEIIEGKPATVRSDLFSLGTMLYWLSCGKLPFLAPTPAALLRLIMECKPVDPRMVRPTVSDGQARLILRCLARDPQHRPASASELSRELTALLAEAGIDRPREELTAFVQSQPPAAHAQKLRLRLVERALQNGRAALAARRTTQALAAFSRALSLDPQNEAAREQVERIHQRTRRNRMIRRSAFGASLVLMVGVGGTRATSWFRDAQTKAAPAVAATAPAPSPFDAGTPPPAVEPPREAAAEKKPAPEPDEEDVPPAPEPAREPVKRPPPRLAVAPANPPQQARADEQTVPVNIRINLPARLTIDGRDYGVEQEFTIPLTRGPHTFYVHKDEFEDRTTELVVRDKMDTIRLALGAPKAARVSVTGAPADAPVKIDGALIGTVGELLNKPYAVAMVPGKVHRDVEISVGDKAFRWRLKAGQEQTFDVARQGGR